jgi:serine/threonine-protein kinase
VGILVAGVLVGVGLGAWLGLRPESGPVTPPETAKVEPRPKPPEPSVPETSTGEPVGEQPKPSVASVRVTLRTTPEQVSLTVDGKAYEKGPVVVSATPGQELTVRAEAARYRPLSRTLPVGEAPEQELTLTLEPLPEPMHREERKVEPVRTVATETRETRPAEARKAMVRFVVKPITVWAEVSCNGTKMGETPFRDVQMTVGTYECKFSNPDQGTRTRRVEVKPGVPNIVVVQF